MFDYVAAEPLEVLRSCCCCLRQSPEKYLKTPYTYDGKIEIYMDMLKDSLDIHLDIDSNEGGICSVCVGRLRDASDFKLQVQRSQAELWARLERAARIIDEEKIVKSELADDCEDFMLYYADEEPLNNSYSIEDSDEDAESSSKDLPDTLHSLSARSLPSAAVKQLAMSCSVSLERVDVARVTHPCHTCQRTFLDQATLEKHMKDDSCHEHTCDTCGRQFKRKSSFEKHVRTHMTKQSGVSCENISERKEGRRIRSKKISNQKDCNQISAKEISDQKEGNQISAKKISDQKDGNQISAKKISDQKDGNQICAQKISDQKDGNQSSAKKISDQKDGNQISAKKISDEKDGNQIYAKKISDQKDGNQICANKISDQKDGNQSSAKKISDKKELCKRIRSKRISGHKEASNQITSKKKSDHKEASNRSISKKISDRKRVNKQVTRKQSPKLIKNTSTIRGQERLNKHENNVTPFTCKVCNKKFAHKNNLNNHSRLHTGNEIHGCKFCNKKFTHLVYLNRHTHQHTGNKPYTSKILKLIRI